MKLPRALPGMLLYLTLWFPPAYRARANALFMIAMPVTAALGSALSGYILSLDGAWNLAGWQCAVHAGRLAIGAARPGGVLLPG
jgi:hypothetical protein